MSQNKSKHAWYVWLAGGRNPKPARGPHPSLGSALAALERFRDKHGYLAGTYEAAGDLRLVECATRSDAQGRHQ